MRVILAALLWLAISPAFAQITDNFGRSISVSGNTYSVEDAKDGTQFSVTAATTAQALSIINSMQPAWHVPPALPNPTVITSIAFLDRFTPAEQAAVQAAAAAAPTTLGVGLTTGLAAGTIDLISPVLKVWMNGLVTAGAITSARETVILTP